MAIKDDAPKDSQSKFEEDLKAYFPEVHNLHVYGRLDPKIWIVTHRMVDLFDRKAFGKIEISYQAGRINHVVTSIREEGE